MPLDRSTGLALLVLLCALFGYCLYRVFKREEVEDEEPPTLPPDYLAEVHQPDLSLVSRVPARCPRFSPIPDFSLPLLPDDVPRYPPVTLAGYRWLVNHALENGVLANIPVPVLYISPLLAHFAADVEDGRLVEDEDQDGHLLVVPLVSTTGEHRAIH